jgi:hypothetical protein
MRKRVTLSDDDIELVETALTMLQDKSDSLPRTYPEHGLAARQRFSQLRRKLKIEPSIQKASAGSINDNIPQTESDN